jgi:hypothetical protein
MSLPSEFEFARIYYGGAEDYSLGRGIVTPKPSVAEQAIALCRNWPVKRRKAR